MNDEDEEEPKPLSSRAEIGFPRFEHNQWTIEGEIERFGAFGRAGARARGWKRVVAVGLALVLVLPLLIGAGVNIWSALR